MQISARADYALRALCVLASAPEQRVVKADEIARAQGIPRTFLDGILVELRRAGLIHSRRGPEGGHCLARPAYAISLADVIRVTDGPLALVQGERPESHVYTGPARHLQDVWVAVRASLREILELTTVAQVVEGRLPEAVLAYTRQDRSWQSVWPGKGRGPAKAAPARKDGPDKASGGERGGTPASALDPEPDTARGSAPGSPDAEAGRARGSLPASPEAGPDTARGETHGSPGTGPDASSGASPSAGAAQLARRPSDSVTPAK